MEFSNYVQTLGTLLSLPHSVHTERAARHLVCTQVIRANPIPSVAECDAEMVEMRACNG